MNQKIAVFLICLAALAGSVRAWPSPGMVAPDFILDQSTTGPDSIRLYDLLGEVVYINFFGATCPICQSDGWLSEQIYDTFATDPNVNVLGLDVWDAPVFYLNGSFRTITGITYPLLHHARATGYAYDMENEPAPSPTDNEGRGHVVIDQQGVIQYYANFDFFDETNRDEIIALIRSLTDPCHGVPELPPPLNAAVSVDSVGVHLFWQPVPCATRYLIMRSLTGDFQDEIIADIVPGPPVFIMPTYDLAVYRVVAERIEFSQSGIKDKP
ncbi:MAG: redoxin domain-containing protein [bacterium]|nr:redoxin domain-containing protein [bacterium]